MVTKRRVKVDDPHLDELPAVDNLIDSRTVRDVLEYLRRHPARTLGYRHADITTALHLRVWLWWDERREELRWLKAGRAAGMFLSQLGEPLGIGKRGVLNLIDRREALLRFDRPDEKLAREARRKTWYEHIETAWIEQHRDTLHTLISDLEREATRWGLEGDDRAMLDELVIDAADDHDEHAEDGLTPGSMTLLNLAVLELSTAEPVAALADQPQPYNVHRVLQRAHHLRCDFAGLGKSTHDAVKAARAAGPKRRHRRTRKARA
ncbi:hypothetical protein MOQ72_27015 [Saccharopolyspora sp. K220]|uniref:hypothetical protein n=1 Tax=Saccharopolyspora soli TaxID=2926618 RepID=UPI001F571D8C|nr:hypothetical protein [Saccharopolyspora soli]MCI2421100.1 hypothetical protein [Saccharopolyspora soli]